MFQPKFDTIKDMKSKEEMKHVEKKKSESPYKGETFGL